MQKINKLLLTVKREALEDAERRKHEELEQAISRMTTDQLRELVDGEPSEDRIKEIFESVGCLHLLESG